MLLEIKAFGVITYCSGEVAFAGKIEKPLNFREKVLLQCVQAARIAYIIPEQGSVWEGEGILIYKDVYNQYHLYFDTSKYSSSGAYCENGVGMIGFILVEGPEQALGFAVENLVPIQTEIPSKQILSLPA